ncbi:hypothetical protein PACTADRAFT_140096 [Pachysolen tannophilus NRRL Y-2460]|uniref:CP-type G domain-containing protein n=1 Tax=Pachysolen tannophilus NRRL Y-2460 TaxID=669874 RepID=A0A1E4U0R1_PACTA|nr:hypothetical protein PACTADRAFT_140096 [Pachysolen tannophilus NRRL Y-2460]
MRVRKPSSKRTSTRMREGIKKKAAAHQRKQRKLSKKDPTWKSKQKKDPGIPASFPYKDKILLQIEESRRHEQEEKEKRKLAKKNAAAASGDAYDEAMSEDDEDEQDDGANGLAALLTSAQQAAIEYEGGSPDKDDIDEDGMDEDHEVIEHDIDFFASDNEDDEENNAAVDKSRKAYDKIFKAVVEASDVVLYVLDARDPESTRSKKVEETILQNHSKRLILILNKVDLVPENVLKQWLDFYQSSFPTIPLKSSFTASNSSSFNKKLTQAVTSNSLLQALKAYANKSNLKRSIIVGIIGYPNVGKSSIINSLVSRHGGNKVVCPVGNQAGVTTSLREIKIDNKLKVLDSPGIVFPSTDKKQSKIKHEAQLALLNAIPPKQVKDPISAVTLLVKRISKQQEMTLAFRKYYQLPPIIKPTAEEFAKEVLVHVARRLGRLGKGGIPNLKAAALAILNDWRDGKFVGWTLPKNSREAAAAADSANGHDVKEKSASQNGIPPPKVEQTTIVKEWSAEFDLDGLFNGVFGE